jgi:hypothetical protein
MGRAFAASLLRVSAARYWPNFAAVRSTRGPGCAVAPAGRGVAAQPCVGRHSRRTWPRTIGIITNPKYRQRRHGAPAAQAAPAGAVNGDPDFRGHGAGTSPLKARRSLPCRTPGSVHGGSPSTKYLFKLMACILSPCPGVPLPHGLGSGTVYPRSRSRGRRVGTGPSQVSVGRKGWGTAVAGPAAIAANIARGFGMGLVVASIHC